MSTLRTNTITDASGANSMPVADINQGRAKSWSNFNGTGVIALRDSFGVSGLTDNAVGNYTVNYSASMANANNCPIIAWNGNTICGAIIAVSASNVQLETFNSNSGANGDRGSVHTNTIGDA